MWRTFLKAILPPFLLTILRKLRSQGRLRWSGSYVSWNEALRYSSGYDAENIIRQVRDSVTKVIGGEAAFERDGVVFKEPSTNLPLMASLFLAFSDASKIVHVLDFGGSLGSSYWQHRAFLEGRRLRWSVIEQENFVAMGRSMPLKPLEFSTSFGETRFNSGESTFLIFSSVLQYLVEPETVLRQSISEVAPDWIFIDRTPFVPQRQHRLTVQSVPESIYKASYPCWFFSKKSLHAVLHEKYQLVFEFPALDRCDDFASSFEGSLWRCKS